MKGILLVFILFNFFKLHYGEVASKTSEDDLNNISNRVKINKCCEEYELYIGNSCVNYKTANQTLWNPIFVNEKGVADFSIVPQYVIGYPDCGSHQRWPVYHNQNSSDSLRLLPNGVLRHYIIHIVPGEEMEEEIETVNGKDRLYYDYVPGKYCMEKRVEDHSFSEFAWVCSPKYTVDWTATEFLMRNIVSPITHLITITCFLATCIIYIVQRSLRDLSGGVVSTICICLIVSQAADLIRLLTVFNSHIDLLITEGFCYFSMLAAFLWLTCLGHYIWKVFRSRNVFLRSTECRKYCLRSIVIWTCTAAIAAAAIFSHLTMEYPQANTYNKIDKESDEIGSLGMIIFFIPVAFCITADVYFFASTYKIINKMHTYGRLHHKLRHSFRMFILLLIIMTTTWLFFLLTLSKFDGLINCYIIVNAIQGPAIFYICCINQSHVAFLYSTTCCYQCLACNRCRERDEMNWGDELTAMNTANNY